MLRRDDPLWPRPRREEDECVSAKSMEAKESNVPEAAEPISEVCARWALFVPELRTLLKSGQEFDEKVFKSKVADYEWNWTLSNKTYVDQPVGDSVEIAQILYEKYAPASGIAE